MSTDEERIYSIALTQIPGVGHIGAKRLVDGMGSVPSCPTVCPE